MTHSDRWDRVSCEVYEDVRPFERGKGWRIAVRAIASVDDQHQHAYHTVYMCVNGGMVSDGQAAADVCHTFSTSTKYISADRSLAHPAGGADAKKLLETLQTQASADIRRSALMLQQQVKLGMKRNGLYER